MILCSIYYTLYHNCIKPQTVTFYRVSLYGNTLRSLCVSHFLNNKWGTKKKHRNIKLNIITDNMVDPQTEEILAPLRAKVKEQVCNQM